MNKSNWEAIIQFRPAMMSNAVYLVRRTHIGAREYLKGNGTVITFTAEDYIKESDDPIFAWLDDSMLAALAAAITKQGIKTPDQNLIQGKLEATERHLEDMRTIALKKYESKS